MASSGSAEPVYVRLRAVREATGETQLAFLPRLNREAAARGVREYSQSTLSKLESGSQAATFDDIAVFAAVDPKRRGKLWLAWGESADETMQPDAGESSNSSRASPMRRALGKLERAATEDGASAPKVRDVPLEAMERVTPKKPAAPRKRANGR